LSTLNPLSLAVLELLHEKPMHPYEMRRYVLQRGLDHVIRLKDASLYSAVARLAKAGLIEEVETNRDGRRPERTVYRITDAGLDELMTGLRALISEPAQEFPLFAAGLAFIAAIPPEEVMPLLEWRAVRLEAAIAADQATLAGVERTGVPRLFVIEAEYLHELRKAELATVRNIVAQMRSGLLTWPDETLALHEHKGERE
jgi:DNA-binding PadR family transcriptional regulator